MSAARDSVVATVAARPLVKWAGGKTKLLPELLPLLRPALAASPRARYHEPFVGGGAVFFALAYERGTIFTRGFDAVLGDVNEELIALYRAARDDAERLIRMLGAHEAHHARIGPDYYYEQRKLSGVRTSAGPAHQVSDAALGARFLYLNKACFNGLYRVNAAGRFNVPIGDKLGGDDNATPTILDEPNVRAASVALRGADVRRETYDAAFARMRPGDVCYLDPPYLKVHAGTFDRYQAAAFGEAEHRELATLAAEADDAGVFVVASNADVPLARELWPESRWDVRRVGVARSINSKGTARGKVWELIISSRRGA